MTGRGMAGERVERVAVVLDELDAGEWVLAPRRRAPVKVPVVCPPGHVTFKAYLAAESAARGMVPHSLYVCMKRHPEVCPPIKKVHGRAWFVPLAAMSAAAKAHLRGERAQARTTNDEGRAAA